MEGGEVEGPRRKQCGGSCGTLGVDGYKDLVFSLMGATVPPSSHLICDHRGETWGMSGEVLCSRR